jgi:hypothetical protein
MPKHPTAAPLSGQARAVQLAQLDTLQALLCRKLLNRLSPDLRDLFLAYDTLSSVREDLDNGRPVPANVLKPATRQAEFLLTKNG